MLKVIGAISFDLVTRSYFQFPDQLAVLAFPCNQFGHQNTANTLEEMSNSLAHVRPGEGYVFQGELFDRLEVNGEGEHPVFRWCKDQLPEPHDLADRSGTVNSKSPNMAFP